MEWIKKGVIFNANGIYDWSKTHAQVPIADKINNGRIRIYYSTRNIHNQSQISYVEVLSDNITEVVYQHNKPILEFGKIGTFDESGMMPAHIIDVNGLKYLYYIGWSKRLSVPYHNDIGLAISNDGGLTFSKFGEGPILGTTYKEPYFNGTCFVLKHSDLYQMYYLSCNGWKSFNGNLEPFYNIKYAESFDGIHWIRNGKVAIDLKENEGGLASATIIYSGNFYKMWYSYRGLESYRTDINETYKIGYAESNDAINWERKDNFAGIKVSESGWDSQMIAYPFVIEINNKYIMFYNGNGFGKTGFGYAILKE